MFFDLSFSGPIGIGIQKDCLKDHERRNRRSSQEKMPGLSKD
jgi:hypothetical protein